MSAAKHTPGPWTLGYPEPDGVTGPTASPLVWFDGTGVKSQIITAGQSVVAIIARDGGLEEVQHADARLIAMAPTMLEALLEAAGALQGAAECMRKVDAPKTADKLEEIALAAMLVIAKATGSAA